MFCGLMLSASAATEDVSLSVYKADGSSLAADEAVQVGDVISVKLSVNKELTSNTANFLVWYDKEVFSFDADASSFSAAVTNAFARTYIKYAETINEPTASQQEKLNAGLLPAMITVTNLGEDVTVPAGEWVTLKFTALKETASTQLTTEIREILHTVDGDDTAEITELTAGSMTLTVEAEATVISVTAVTLNKETTSLDPGNSTTIVATITPTDATEEIVWSSDNEDVCTVTQDATRPLRATITAVSVGTAHVTVTAGSFSKSCEVKVRISVTSITLDKNTATIKAGKSVQLTPTIKPENPTDSSIIWTSSNSNVATVDSNGLVTGISQGSARITVQSVSNPNCTATCTVTVITPTEGNYTIISAEDIQGVVSGDTVSIPVSIGNNTNAEADYNAYRVLVNYDPSALEFVSASSVNNSEQFSALAENGIITVSDFGTAKNLGEAFILKFTALAATGSTTVEATEAQVDIGENAVSENAPEASLENPDTVIYFKEQYTVSLTDDFETDMSTIVEPGGSITFSIKDYNPNYIYTVSATMAGEPVTVTDNQDGTYTIENITENVVVNTLEKAGKTFAVEFPDSLTEVTGESTAVYGTDYCFTITEEEGYTYAVSVKIGDTAYALNEPVEGKYTVSGSAITDTVIISIVKTEKPVTYPVTLGAGATGDSSATKGVDYVFTVEESEDYEWKVTVTVNNVEYSNYTISGYTYTIPGADVVGEIVVSTEKAEKTYPVKFIQTNGKPISVTYIFSDNSRSTAVEVDDTAVKGHDFTFRIIYRTAYVYDMQVTMGGEPITPEADKEHSLTSANPNIGYTIKDVTGPIEIKLTRHMNLEVKYFEYLQLDGKTVYLVLASETNQGRAIYYNNQILLNGQKYGTSVMENGKSPSAWLVITDASFDKEAFTEDLRLNSVNIPSGSPQSAGLATLNDVNSSGFIDINDAQLVYDIYNGQYDSFDIVTMKKFLQADVNADTKVDVVDAAAVVNAIN